MKTENRVEKHVLKPAHPYYDMLRGYCMKSKALYNHANYLVRQVFISEGKWLRYGVLDKILKADTEFPDYRNMPTAQSAQQTLRVLDSNWKAFFAAIKDYKAHPDRYLGRPKLPKYLKRSAFNIILTNQNCSLRDGVIKFPKTFGGFSIRPSFPEKENSNSFRQVRFIPRNNCIIMEIVYDVLIPDEKPYNGHSIGIDMGVNNLAAAADNRGNRPFIINGRPLKSINRYFNKEKAHYQSVLEQMNGRRISKRLNRLMEKRDRQINDYLHKASRYLVDHCAGHGITQIIIGRNKDWKQHPHMDKKNNQNFVQLPVARFIDMVSYKAKEYGIAVKTPEEAYTSGTSFLDNEEPVRRNYNKSRRVYRGLFYADDGTFINADVNAAYQIMKKVVPVQRDSGCVLHPFVVSL